MRRTLIGLMAMVMVVACGQAQARTSTSPPAAADASPSATASSPLLFAVLEAKGTANAWTYNTVAIAGLDGYARAKTTFAPIPAPNLGCIGAVLPQSAHVAAGKVFFADGKGVVRSLAIDGTVTKVATFPLTSTQQMLSFAVSPDGANLVATVFTTPKGAYSCSGPSTGTFTFDAYSASSGGTSHLVYHESWTKPQNVLALTGWDSVGPIGTYPTVWASQGGGPGSTLGVLVRVNAGTLKPGAPLSNPSTCLVWDAIASGAFVCTKDGVISNPGTAQQSVAVPVSVRLANGSQSWQFTISGMNGPSSPHLNPNGAQVIMCCSDDTREWLIGRDGSRTKLAGSFYGAGWLDSTTVIGEYHPNPLAQAPLPLGYVSLKAPGTVVSMGFSGLFVGTVRI